MTRSSTMSNREITIGTRRVGPGLPVYFIAEAGSNHDGSFEQAKRLVDVAADAGADAVKFQAFRAASLYPKNAGASEYLKDARSIYDIIRSLEMPLEWLAPLAAYCAQRGLHFLCTPFDWETADAMAPYVPAFKIASYDMTNYPLIQHVARKGRPLIVSTGTAEMDEVREMLAAVDAVGNAGIIVLQCTAKYPAPLEALNVRALVTMAQLGVLTGLSDHSREPLPGILAAVSLGAAVIEKHFTLSNQLPGPDHVYALEPHELKEVIAKVREIERVLGSGEKTVQPEERELRAFARRTIMTTRAVGEGERLRRPDLAILRCGALPYGMHPKEHTRLFGRTLVRALAAETPLREEDVGGFLLREGEVSLRLVEHEDPSRLRTDRLDLVVEVAGAGPVGRATLAGIDFGANAAEIGVSIVAASERQQALGGRAMALLLEHAFETLGMQQIRHPAPGESGWIRDALARFGFVESHRAEGSPGADGGPTDTGALALTALEWTRRRAPPRP